MKKIKKVSGEYVAQQDIEAGDIVEVIDTDFFDHGKKEIKIDARMNMIINRKWAMPNKETFKIKPIKELLNKYVKGNWADPYSGENSPASIKNDLDPSIKVFSHKEAQEFLKEISDNEVEGVLFDPPYSPRQLSESYKKFGLSVNMQTTQSSYWSKCRKEIARIVKKEGIVISFGWNSCGIGKKLGFEIIEILLVSHGGGHNDTICTVERKSLF